MNIRNRSYRPHVVSLNLYTTVSITGSAESDTLVCSKRDEVWQKLGASTAAPDRAFIAAHQSRSPNSTSPSIEIALRWRGGPSPSVRLPLIISDSKVPCGPANQREPVPERVRIIPLFFHVRWPSHPSVLIGQWESRPLWMVRQKSCRRSGHRRQRGLARGSGDPTRVYITSEGLSSRVEVVECSTMSCNLSVSYFYRPHNVGFYIGGRKR